MPKSGINKQKIIQTAAELADKNGLNGVTIKEISRELGVRSPSLYNHINSLDDILESLTIYGWKQIGNAMAMSAVGKSGDDAVRAQCYAFRDYSLAHPGVFEAMMWYKQFKSEETMQATAELLEINNKVLSAYSLYDEDLVHTTRMLRSFLQGFASIENKGSFSDPVSIQKSFDFAVEILINGLNTIEIKAKPHK